MNKLKEQLLSTDMAPWRKKGLFFTIVVLSIFPFFITYQASSPELYETLKQLRHFIGIAIFQAVAQISLAWYLLKHRIPNYAVLCLLIMVLSFQVTYGISVVLMTIAQ